MCRLICHGTILVLTLPILARPTLQPRHSALCGVVRLASGLSMSCQKASE